VEESRYHIISRMIQNFRYTESEAVLKCNVGLKRLL